MSYKLNSKGFAHVAALAVLVLGVALYGTYSLVGSKAARPNKQATTGTELYFTQDYRNANLPPYGSPGTTVVTSRVNLLGSIGNEEQVLQIAPGGELRFGGKGGQFPDEPALLSGKTCYIMHSVDTAGQASIASGTAVQTVVLKAPLIRDNFGQSGTWQNICANNSYAGSTFPTYNVKNTGPTKINVYRANYLNTYNY